MIGTGIVAGPIGWTSGTPVNYGIPEDLAPGDYTYNITFTDDAGNSASATTTVTILSSSDGGTIPFGNLFLLFAVIGSISLILIIKRRIFRDSI